MSHGCLELLYVKIDHTFVDKKLIQSLVFTSDFVTKAVTEIWDTLYAIWQKMQFFLKF